MIETFVSKSPEETQHIGEQIAKSLKDGDLICLTGHLGAGKTTFMKGLAHFLTRIAPDEIVSPTFGYLNIYPSTPPLYHFDLYRLQGPEEFIEAGFLDFLGKGICCIEWPDKLPTALHEKIQTRKISIEINYLSEEERTITIQSNL